MGHYDYISTYTGRKYYFLNPVANDVCIEDIAHALSMNCRYNGHVKDFYSVAEHCCIISDYILNKTGCKKQAFSALLHDASEAYLTDIPRPIKPFLNGYSDIEEKSEKAVQAKFKCEPPSELIKHIDQHMVRAEAEKLFINVPKWVFDYEHIEISIKNLSPLMAKLAFLKRFRNLGGVQ